ncbi:MAG: glycosyltransferase family 39 protein [Gemmatimonadota bacterium]|nr:glycosyltransferase family 39 protein [Gemmatimonadota bacterium]
MTTSTFPEATVRGGGPLWALAAVAAIVTYALGLGLDVLEVDAAQYAAIAREMSETGGWLEVTDRGEPFLNKPPLLFWLSALSFRVFGVSNVAYKLPSFLIFLVGVWSTHRLAARYAGPRAGALSALVLATCQGAFLMNNDVRTDALLMGLVAFAMWQLARFLDEPDWPRAAWVGLGLGAAMLAKGLIGAMVPLLGAATHIALTRRWDRVLRPEWLLAGVIAAALLTPMTVGLYRQHGADGLEFYFWTQGFGRVFSENIWGDEHGPFFFVIQMLWTFLPWTLFLGAALWWRFGELRRCGWRLPSGSEALSLGAFVLGLVGISASRSKLPHYVYVTLPAAAVLTGTWMATLLGDGGFGRVLRISQRVVLAVLAVVLGVLIAWAFPLRSALLWGAIGALTVAVVLVLAGRVGVIAGDADAASGRAVRLVLGSTLAIVAVNLALNGHLYPTVLDYQASARAGRDVSAADPPPRTLITYGRGGKALDFYARRVAVHPTSVDALELAVADGRRAAGGAASIWVFTDEPGLDELRSAGVGYTLLATYDDFAVSKITPRFLNPSARGDALAEAYLIRLE